MSTERELIARIHAGLVRRTRLARWGLVACYAGLVAYITFLLWCLL